MRHQQYVYTRPKHKRLRPYWTPYRKTGWHLTSSLKYSSRSQVQTRKSAEATGMQLLQAGFSEEKIPLLAKGSRPPQIEACSWPFSVFLMEMPLTASESTMINVYFRTDFILEQILLVVLSVTSHLQPPFFRDSVQLLQSIVLCQQCNIMWFQKQFVFKIMQ